MGRGVLCLPPHHGRGCQSRQDDKEERHADGDGRGHGHGDAHCRQAEAEEEHAAAGGPAVVGAHRCDVRHQAGHEQRLAFVGRGGVGEGCHVVWVTNGGWRVAGGGWHGGTVSASEPCRSPTCPNPNKLCVMSTAARE